MNTLKLKIWIFRATIILGPIIALLLFFKLVLPDASKKYSRHSFGGGIEHKTKNFLIRVKLKAQKPEDVGKLVEDFYSAFVNTYGKKMGYVGLEKPVEIFFFGDKKEFEEFHRSQRMTSVHPAAYFDPLIGRIVLYWSFSSHKILYHELTHMILEMSLGAYRPFWSTWLNEGLAEYIEECSIQKGKLVPGELDKQAVKIVSFSVEAKKFIPLRNLCAASPKVFYHPDKNLNYYKQSYLLVYFLLHADKGKYRDRFYEYFAEERKTGECPSYVLWRILGKQPEELEKIFKRFYKIQ